ncbi:MAG: hypothetical protein P1U89_27115, partial [Verrucomicrobiales bacterium]|nr:hypothetical protein [Verrucomicrobiales bacterium]
MSPRFGFSQNDRFVTQVVEVEDKVQAACGLWLNGVQFTAEVFPFPLLWRLLVSTKTRASSENLNFRHI